MELLKTSWKVQKPTKKAKVWENSRVFPLLVPSPWYHHGRFMIRNFSKSCHHDCPTDFVLVGVPKAVVSAENHFFPPKGKVYFKKLRKVSIFASKTASNPNECRPNFLHFQWTQQMKSKLCLCQSVYFFFLFLNQKKKKVFFKIFWGPRPPWSYLTQSEGQSESWEILEFQI